MTAAFQRIPKLEKQIADMAKIMEGVNETFQHERRAFNNSQDHLAEVQRSLLQCEIARARLQNESQEQWQDNKTLTEALQAEQEAHKKTKNLLLGTEELLKIRHGQIADEFHQEPAIIKAEDNPLNHTQDGGNLVQGDESCIQRIRELEKRVSDYIALWHQAYMRAEALEQTLTVLQTTRSRDLTGETWQGASGITRSTAGDFIKVGNPPRRRKRGYRYNKKQVANKNKAEINNQVDETENDVGKL